MAGLTFRLHWWWLESFWWADPRSAMTVWFWLRFAVVLAPLLRLPGASVSSSLDSPQSSYSPCICRLKSTWFLPDVNSERETVNFAFKDPTRGLNALTFRSSSPHNTRSSSSGSRIFYSCTLCCVSCLTRLLCLCQSWAWRPPGFGLNKPAGRHVIL